MRQQLDIAIAGCGPAGLSAALFLARAGHRVTLFEQFSEPRPIGSGLMLQPTGLAVLAELGLAHRMLALGRRIDRLSGRVVPSNRIVLDVRYNPGSFGLAVHRAALFETLFDAVRAEGIAVRTGRRIEGVEHQGNRARLLCGGAAEGPFDLVVDALGMRSPLMPALGGAGARRELSYGALWATLPWPAGRFDEHALEQRYEEASVMIGVLPIGRRREGEAELAAFFWSLKPEFYARWRDEGLAPWKERVLRLWPQTAVLLDGIEDPGQLTLARYSHHTLATPVRDRLVAIGDAAHATSPQLGQGANMALLDARALALALESGADLAGALAQYARWRRWHVRFYQQLSALFTPFYQSDSRILPPLRDWLVAPATRLPLVRTMVAAIVAGTLLDPRARLGLAREIPPPLLQALAPEA